jgi:hypothetical protein
MTTIQHINMMLFYMQTDIVTMDSEDTNGNWGFVQKLPSEIYKKLGADTAKEIKLPYFEI